MKRVFLIIAAAMLIGVMVLVTAVPAMGYTPGVWTGKGTLENGTSFALRLHDVVDHNQNTLRVDSGGNRFQLTQLTYVEVSNDPTIEPQFPAVKDTYHGKGVGKYNGVGGYKAEWIFTDASGTPGAEHWGWIMITDAAGTWPPALEDSGHLITGDTRAG